MRDVIPETTALVLAERVVEMGGIVFAASADGVNGYNVLPAHAIAEGYVDEHGLDDHCGQSNRLLRRMELATFSRHLEKSSQGKNGFLVTLLLRGSRESA